MTWGAYDQNETAYVWGATRKCSADLSRPCSALSVEDGGKGDAAFVDEVAQRVVSRSLRGLRLTVLARTGRLPSCVSASSLERLEVWSPGIRNWDTIGVPSSLRRAELVSYADSVADRFAGCESLETIALYRPRLERLELRCNDAWLFRSPVATNLEAMTTSALILDTCHGIRLHRRFAQPTIRYLRVEHHAEVGDVEFVEGFPHLVELSMAKVPRLRDASLLPIAHHPALKRVRIQLPRARLMPLVRELAGRDVVVSNGTTYYQHGERCSIARWGASQEPERSKVGAS